jgi:hypothetical protein
MVFSTDFRSLSKSFLLLLLISGLQIGAADPQITITPQEPGAPMPTRSGCLNGWEVKQGNKVTKNPGFVADAESFNTLYRETSAEANTKKEALFNDMNRQILYMKVPIIHKQSLGKKERQDPNWFEQLLEKTRNQREKPKNYDSPVLDLLWEFGTVFNNKNCAALFFTLGGYASLNEASKQLILCSTTLDNSLTVVGDNPETNLPMHTKKLQTHIAATRLVANAMKSFLKKSEEWHVDFTADSAPFIDLNNEMLIKSLKKESGANCADQEIRNIILSAYTTQLEKQVEALKNSELQKQKTELENHIKQQDSALNQLKIQHGQLTQAKNKAEEDRDKWKQGHNNASAEASNLKKELQKIQEKLATTECDLKKVAEEKKEVDGNFKTLMERNRKLLNDATNYNTNVATLSQQLTKLQQELDTFRNKKNGKTDPKPKSRFSFLPNRSFWAGSATTSFLSFLGAIWAWKVGFLTLIF